MTEERDAALARRRIDKLSHTKKLTWLWELVCKEGDGVDEYDVYVYESLREALSRLEGLEK